MKKRFLVVSPHPDDAELGMSGIILKLKDRGHRVWIVDLTTGEPTPFGNEKLRRKETEKASLKMNLNGRFNLGLENRYLFDTKEARLRLAEKIRILKPDIIFAPNYDDTHPDHTAAAEIAVGARFYSKFTKTELKGKPHYPPCLLHYHFSHKRTMPEFSFLVDISNYFKKKVEVIRCYRSQFIVNKKNRFLLKSTEKLNSYLGSLIHVEYAEPLYSSEALKISDITRLL